MPRNGMYHGPATISPGPQRLLTTAEVEGEIESVAREHEGDPDGDHEISDAAAATICAWWMGPGRDGRAFSTLVHVGTVGLEALADDLSAALRDCHPSSWNYNALGYVATWALNHHTRSDRGE